MAVTVIYLGASTFPRIIFRRVHIIAESDYSKSVHRVPIDGFS